MGSKHRIRAGIACGAVASAVLTAACASQTPSARSQFAASLWEGDRLGDFMAARYAAHIGDQAAAAHYYASVFEKSPSDPEALDTAVSGALLALRAQDAAELARTAHPDVLAAAPFASLALISADIASNRLERARRRLARAEFDTGNAVIARALAAAIAKESGLEAALAAFNARPSTKTCLAQFAFSARGRHTEALRAGADLAAAGRATPPDCFALRARLLAAAGQGDAAIEALSKFQPMFLGESGDPALEALTRSLKSGAGAQADATDLSAQRVAALALYLAVQDVGADGGDQTTTTYLALALYIDPRADFLRMRLSDVLRRQRRDMDALAVLGPVENGSPYGPSARLWEARLQTKLGQIQEALRTLETAVRLLDEAGLSAATPEGREDRFRVAEAYRAAGDSARAEAILTDIITHTANNGVSDWRPLFARARALDALGRWPEAEQDLTAALQLAPKEPELLNYLGYNWIDRGVRVEEGLDMIREALQAAPRAPHIIDSLGWGEFRLGKYDEAIEHLLKAAELAPTDPNITSHLGDALWRAGRHDEARYEWSRALRLRPIEATEQALERKIREGLPEAEVALEQPTVRIP